ncbi:MAG: hypothetical protein WCK31_00425 [bacterium]
MSKDENRGKNALIPILVDHNHVMGESVKGMFTYKRTLEDTLSCGAILVKEISKLPEGGYYDYMATLVHELDHAMFYFFNTTYKQQVIKDIDKLDIQSAEALKEIQNIPKIYEKTSSLEEFQIKSEEYNKLVAEIEVEAVLINSKRKKLLDESSLFRNTLSNLSSIVSEGMARRAQEYFNENLKKNFLKSGRRNRLLSTN